MEVILYNPQIPSNTGNVIRTCAVTGSALGLVPPMGFRLSDRLAKRAGLDYWKEVPLNYIDDLDTYIQESKRRPLFFSSKATKFYTEVSYNKDDLLIFGSETDGLPDAIHETYSDNFYTIPMVEGARCLNLSNSVAIVLYEALRQQKFL